MKLSNLVEDQEASLQDFMNDWKQVIKTMYFQQYEDIENNMHCQLLKDPLGIYIQLQVHVGDHGSVTFVSFNVEPAHSTYSKLERLARSGQYDLLSFKNTKLLRKISLFQSAHLYNRNWVVQVGLLSSNQEICPNAIPAFLYKVLTCPPIKETL